MTRETNPQTNKNREVSCQLPWSLRGALTASKKVLPEQEKAL